MGYDKRVEKFFISETPFNRRLRDRQRQLRREFGKYGEDFVEPPTQPLPFNWKNLDLWTRHLCRSPMFSAPGKPGEKARPSMLYGYFHLDNKVEGLCIVPATNSVKKVHASMALYPAEQRKGLNEKNLSAYMLSSVYTITNSSQFFRVPSMPTRKGSLFLTKEEALAFFARRIHALLFNDFDNIGNFSRHIFKSAVYEGPVFNLEPGKIAQDTLLPDVVGRWPSQSPRYPLGITQDEIDNLTEMVLKVGYRPPLPVESYIAAAREGVDAFSPTPELGAAALSRITHLTGFPDNGINGVEAHPVDPEI